MTGSDGMAEALFYTAPGEAETRPVRLSPLVPGWVQIRTRCSGISRGTERLVSAGAVPESEWQTMRAPFQEGAFPFPVKYGYAAVGTVEAGPAALLGREVFALHPHQTCFRIPAAAAVPLPEGLPAARAVLGANAETALNAIWDARIPPGSRVLVVGLGLLGCLIAGLLSAREDLTVVASDLIPGRADTISDFNVTFRPPTDVGGGFVRAFHTTASEGGLQTALEALGFEGRLIELSWYGTRPVRVLLGGAFHTRRLAIVSSQVGQVAPDRRAAWPHARRLAAALETLRDPRFDRLITQDLAFRDLPAALPRLLADGAEGIATRIVYDTD